MNRTCSSDVGAVLEDQSFAEWKVFTLLTATNFNDEIKLQPDKAIIW
jgi:hypothetical protein